MYYVYINLQFYFLFMDQCFVLSMLLNYPCALSPPLPQEIKSTLYVDLSRGRLHYTMLIFVTAVFRLPQHCLFRLWTSGCNSTQPCRWIPKFQRQTLSPCLGLIATANMAAAGHIAMLISAYKTALCRNPKDII